MAIKGYWRFNGDLTDSSGNGINGSGTGTVTYPKGKVNLSAELQKGSYINFGNTANYTSTDFTFSFLLLVKGYSLTDGASNILFVKSNGPYNAQGFYCAQSGTGLSFMTCQTGATQISGASGTNMILLNTWYYIVITRAGANVRIYINSIDKTSTVGTHIDPKTTSDNFIINRYSTNSPYSGNVIYDEFITEDRKWTSAEIKNKYSYYKGFF
jgi:hypothetical protein